jgi:hypothetical protein
MHINTGEKQKITCDMHINKSTKKITCKQNKYGNPKHMRHISHETDLKLTCMPINLHKS